MGSVVHPLLIREIQERICLNLSIPQLLNVRLINNNFNYNAIKHLAQLYQEVKEFRNNEELTSFLEVMQNRIQEQVIYTRYNIRIKEISTELATEFCSQIGPHVTLLTLYQRRRYCQQVQRRTDEEYKKIVVQLLASTRQLKYLSVWTYSEIILTPQEQNSLTNLQVQTLSVQFRDKVTGGGNDGPNGPHTGMSLALFLATNSRSLKEVTVPMLIPPDGRMFDVPNIDLLKQIKVSVRRSIYFVLPHALLVSDRLTEFQQLDQLAIKFRAIYLQGVNDSPELVEFLTQWLRKQENSIEELKIIFPAGHIMGQLHFPTMNALKTLSLTFINGDPVPVFGPIGEGQFPNLQSLTLKWQDGFGGFLFPLPKLTHLELDEVNLLKNFTSEWHRILPNLKSLKFHACALDKNGPAKLSYLLTHFSDLEELELQIQRNDGLLGVDGAEFWDILTGNAPRVKLDEILDVKSRHILYSPHQAQASSLANLKRLRKLTIVVGNYTDVEAIAFLTATGAMKPLEILQISGSSSEIKDPEVYKPLLKQVHEVVRISVVQPQVWS